MPSGRATTLLLEAVQDDNVAMTQLLRDFSAGKEGSDRLAFKMAQDRPWPEVVPILVAHVKASKSFDPDRKAN
jgi:hypothetical protein